VRLPAANGDPSSESPASIPRVGVILELPRPTGATGISTGTSTSTGTGSGTGGGTGGGIDGGTSTLVTWYGLGPHENDPDRNCMYDCI